MIELAIVLDDQEGKCCLKEVSGVEPEVRVLQTLALPFGYTSIGEDKMNV